jgi:hypothetical protein
MEVNVGTRYTTLIPQKSLCSICKYRNDCFIDIEFYRMEQRYSLSGITSECKCFLPIIPSQRIQSEEICVKCDRIDCVTAKKYQDYQNQKGLKRMIVECAYQDLYTRQQSQNGPVQLRLINN